jgi:hypothetical protein
MAWRLARSLQTLLGENIAAAPNRGNALDGTIGDEAHRQRASRHNPNCFGGVTAMDITHDPAHGMDAHKLARLLTKNPHPELAYIISNRQAAYRSRGWVWGPYKGSHPHDHHIHVAVGLGSDADPAPPYDSTQSWHVKELLGKEEDMTDEERGLLQQCRVSDVAQSYEFEIIKALIAGDAAKADRLEREKDQAVKAEKARLKV